MPFFINTGGHEVYLDRALADEFDMPTFGVTTGGKHAVEGHGVLSAIFPGSTSRTRTWSPTSVVTSPSVASSPTSSFASTR